MAIAAAVAAIGGGAALNAVGQFKAANAMEDAGNAQVQAARERIAWEKQALEEQKKNQERGIELGKQYGAMSANEMLSIQRMLTDRDSSFAARLAEIDKERALLEQVDPLVKQSGENLLNLLKGESSAALKPVQDERDRQRRQLEANLASSMGPGFRTTSAGIEALTRFDQESSSLFSNVQQQAIQQQAGLFGGLFGGQLGGQQAISQGVSNAYGMRDTAGQAVWQAESAAQSRLADSVMSGFKTAVDYSGVGNAFGQATQVAGAPFQGDVARGQAISSIGNTFGQLGGMAMGSQLQTQQFNDTWGKVMSQGSAPTTFTTGAIPRS